MAEAGFIVDLVRDGTDGLHHALSEAYDLAILDVMLPGLDGWGVLAASLDAVTTFTIKLPRVS